VNDAIFRMLDRYECQSVDDYVRALREIMQEIALLGLWRSKYFEKAAFYGGTALRILYGMDRFSEDLDFSLVEPMTDFQLSRYGSAVERELRSFGFEASLTTKPKKIASPVQSAFLEILSNVVYGQLGGDPFFFQPVDKFHSFNNISQALRTMQPYPSFLSTLT